MRRVNSQERQVQTTGHQDGFSLLEVLIAIAILAGVAMALGPAISAAARASARIHQQAAVEEDLRTARQFFRDMITQQLLVTPAASAISGNRSTLSLTVLDPGDMAPAELKLTITNEAPARLIASFGDGETDNAVDYTLLANIKDAQFQFLANAQWRDSWSDTALPSLIRLRFIHSDASADPISIEAAPHGQAPLICQFDPVSRRCR